MPKEVLKYAWVPTKVENKWIWLKPYWSLQIIIDRYDGFNLWWDMAYTVNLTLEVGRRNL